MSLRRRITAATTLAVAAVALMVGLVGYLSARSHLIGRTRDQLVSLADTFIANSHGDESLATLGATGTGTGTGTGGGTGGGQGGSQPGTTTSGPSPQQTVTTPRSGQPRDGDEYPSVLPTPPLGGARGTFQIVGANGSVTVLGTSNPVTRLPVPERVLRIARSGRGRYFFSADVKHTHAEILAVGNARNHTAVEVALPLTNIDQELRGLLISYALMVGGGMLLAGLIGTLVARSALGPINRFTDLTEQVTHELDRPRRLEETGATELRRLAISFNQTLDALERSILAQQHLIADASHELRTPMAALRSNIQIFLEAQRLPQEEREELQQAIIAELDELTQLVSDVLDLARGAAPSDHVEQVELDTVVREAIGRTQRRAPELRFETDLQETLIDNAPERVARAVSNVIDNARKWSPPDGVVQVSLRDGVLRVRDHGPGFREVDLPHVFERFYRADEARRMPGSGLGLAIVQQAAGAFGGSARAFNAPDGGAVVEVRFGSRSAPHARQHA